MKGVNYGGRFWQKKQGWEEKKERGLAVLFFCILAIACILVMCF